MKEEVQILGLSVTSLSKGTILLIGALGVFVCFILDGIAHEQLLKHYYVTETFFFTWIQFTGYSLLSLKKAINIWTGQRKISAPFWLYLITSCFLITATGLTNYAAVGLSYPTLALFKASKPIPVLFGNVVLLKRKPKVTEVVSVLLIVVGLIGISMGDFKGKNQFAFSGVVAALLSLIAGGFASNMEDKIMSQYGAAQDELISILYSIGSIMMFVIALLTGQMRSGLTKIVRHSPGSVIFLCFSAFMGSLGIQFVYLIMKVFGSLVTVLITSVRKALTVFLSYLVFRDKVFTSWHAFSIILISIGISLSVIDKTKDQKKTHGTEDDMQLLIPEEEISDGFDRVAM